jgi:hypothetical protein
MKARRFWSLSLLYGGGRFVKGAENPDDFVRFHIFFWVCIHWRTSPVSRSGQHQGHAPQRQMRGKSLLCTTLPLPSKQRPPLTIYFLGNENDKT